MFCGCGDITSLPVNFNIPQGITKVGSTFCYQMFASCITLGALPVNFNLPQNIMTLGDYFCAYMFYDCAHDNFQVNSVFRFPLISQQNLDRSEVFYNMFSCDASKTYIRQPISIATILNGNPVPSSARYTFSTYNATQGANRWSDYNSIHANWK
jgi:hypothetical protein